MTLNECTFCGYRTHDSCIAMGTDISVCPSCGGHESFREVKGMDIPNSSNYLATPDMWECPLCRAEYASSLSEYECEDCGDGCCEACISQLNTVTCKNCIAEAYDELASNGQLPKRGES